MVFPMGKDWHPGRRRRRRYRGHSADPRLEKRDGYHRVPRLSHYRRTAVMPRQSHVLPVLLLTGLLPAQQSLFQGPIEGFTFDPPTRTLRAVIGSLGAASLGPDLLKGLDYASVAPRQNYGLSFQSGRCLVVSGLGSGQL